MSRGFTLLDGPMGSALEARGIALPAPLWTAAAVIEHGDAVVDVHRSYAALGVDVHTAASFRTTARSLADSPWAPRWREVLGRALTLCRAGAGAGARVAGSMAPLEDCYRPDLVPSDAHLASEHGELARALAEAGADLLLVETMNTTRELRAATRAAAATGLPVWAAVTLGPDGDFFSRDALERAAATAADAGAEAFLLNCTPPELVSPRLEHLAGRRARPPRLGAYANALFPGHDAVTPEQYAVHARRWRTAGADILGTCCGTTCAHLAALAALD